MPIPLGAGMANKVHDVSSILITDNGTSAFNYLAADDEFAASSTTLEHDGQ